MNLPRNSCAWKIAGTKFLRHSSSQILETYGMNLQNPSARICQIHIPDDGKIFVQVDQAGAEALIVSYLTSHKRFRDLFLNGIKPHVFVALHIFREQWQKEGHPADFFCGLSIEDIPKQPQWKPFEKVIKNHKNRYFIGKKCVHAGNYREGPKTFQTSILTESDGEVYVSLKDSERFQWMYREELFPEIAHEWWPEVERQLVETRIMYNLFGYPIKFTGIRVDDKLLREATACVPQSTVGTITNLAMSEVQEVLDDSKEYEDVDILNNKHDSLLVQCFIGHEQEVSKLLKGFIEKELTSPRGEKFKMKSEAVAGYNWNDFSETNPNGLKEIA